MFITVADLEFADGIPAAEMDNVITELQSHGYDIVTDSNYGSKRYYLVRNVSYDCKN